MGPAGGLPAARWRSGHARVHDQVKRERLVSGPLWRWPLLGNLAEEYRLRRDALFPVSWGRGCGGSQLGWDVVGGCVALEKELLGVRWNRKGTSDGSGNDTQDGGTWPQCRPAV